LVRICFAFEFTELFKWWRSAFCKNQLLLYCLLRILLIEMKRIKQFPRRFRYKFPYIYKRLNRNSLNLTSSNSIQNGFYCVKIQESCRLQFYVIRALFNILRPMTRDKIDVWFYSRFFIPLTAKPLMRMGTGKGKLRFWVAEYRKGDIILEFSFICSERLRKLIFKTVICKLPMKIKIFSRLFY
jgi:ribosomal protein L16/L10AE